MKSVIERYAEPKSAEDVARAVRVFLADAFEIGPVGVVGPTGGELEFSTEDGPDVTITIEESQQRAMREQQEVPEGRFIEWLTQDEREKLWALRGIGSAKLVEPPPPADFRTKFDLILDVAPGARKRVTMEVRTIEEEAWGRLQARDAANAWSAVQLDDGRILAVRGLDAEGKEASQGRNEPYPERTQAMRRFRSRLVDALEEVEGVGALTAMLDGEGGMTLDVELKESDPRYPRAFPFQVRLEMVPNPDC